MAKKQTWDNDHPSAVFATKLLAEMIATDLQPYSIMENEGFRRYSRNLEPRYALPSRRALSEIIVPDIYGKVKEEVKKSFHTVKICVKTDTWTEATTTRAFVGVSAHWISNEWERRFAVLNCDEFSAKHNGENIAAKFNRVLNDWNLECQRNTSMFLFVIMWRIW